MELGWVAGVKAAATMGDLKLLLMSSPACGNGFGSSALSSLADAAAAAAAA